MTTETAYRADLVRTGLAQVGKPYRDSSVPTNWPPQQFDCSVFTHWLNAKHGIDIDRGRLTTAPWPPPEPTPWDKYPGYTLDQQAASNRLGAGVHFDAIKPGDRLYYDKPGQHHVVLYIGDGQVVHAAGTAYGVIVSHVVGPGEVGHGGKTLTLCVSATKFAKAAGKVFTPSVPAPVPFVVPPYPGKPLGLGSRGDAVKAVQRGLKRRGYAVPVNGVLADATLAAIKRYQGKHPSLWPADGIVGPVTYRLLAR